jgi:cation transport ATPase
MRRHALQRHLRLSHRQELWTYLVGALLLGSGLGWLAAHYLFGGAGEFGESHHPSELWWLRLHGAAAMAFLVVFGSLIPRHIVRAWRERRNHRSGLWLLTLVLVLVVSGYGLYYLDSDALRPWISAIHWGLGLVAAAMLLVHVRLGTRQRAAEIHPRRHHLPHRRGRAI